MSRIAKWLFGVIVFGLVIVAVWKFDLALSPLFWGSILSAIFGAGTGGAEIISRYRDEPVSAVFNKFGLNYIALNAGLAAISFGVLTRYTRLMPAGIPKEYQDDWILRAILAGFGAMVVVRSKLFIYHSDDGKDYPIGPAIVIETFLKMLDRKIDRYRASKRQQRVFAATVAISDFDHSAEYLTASLLSFQNLTQEEKAGITSVIEQYKAYPWPPQLKSAALGMAFLTIAGEDNFDQVMISLQKYLTSLGPTTSGGVGAIGAASGAGATVPNPPQSGSTTPGVLPASVPRQAGP